MSGVEHAGSRSRDGSEFPAAWGIPKGRAGSEERVAWIKANIRAMDIADPNRAVRRQQILLRNELRLAHVKGLLAGWRRRPSDEA